MIDKFADWQTDWQFCEQRKEERLFRAICILSSRLLKMWTSFVKEILFSLFLMNFLNILWIFTVLLLFFRLFPTRALGKWKEKRVEKNIRKNHEIIEYLMNERYNKDSFYFERIEDNMNLSFAHLKSNIYSQETIFSYFRFVVGNGLGMWEELDRVG